MPLEIERLEERIVLNAVVDGDHDPDAPDATDPVTEAAPPQEPPADQNHDAPAADAGDVHALLISSDVREAEALAAAALDNVITVFIDAHTDNADTILHKTQDALAGRQADSIGLATHAAREQGAFELTDSLTVSADALGSSPELHAFWQAMGALLKDDGRIDVMACDLAATQQGTAVVDLLEDITGHDVAASDDATGSGEHADWVLETDGIALTGLYFDPTVVEHTDVRLPSVWYVTPGGSGTDGSTWGTAVSLSYALGNASGGEEIWVAEGTYVTATDASPWTLVAGVDVYGGFSNGDAWGDRDFYTKHTVLSGDLDANGADTGDCHTVVYANGDMLNATFDGLIVTGGYTRNAGAIAQDGAGMYNNGVSNFTVANCWFVDNQDTYGTNLGGGGIYNTSCTNLTISACTFSENYANGGGGGVYNNGSTVLIERCVFGENSSGTNVSGGAIHNAGSTGSIENSLLNWNTAAGGGLGGGLYNTTSNFDITNCIFVGNDAWQGGGVGNVTSSTSNIYNSIFWDNTCGSSGPQGYDMSNLNIGYSDVQGGLGGISGETDLGGNISDNPTFAGYPVAGADTWDGASFDTSTMLTTLTDASQSWTPGDLRGQFIRADTAANVYLPIVDNTATEIFVLGDSSGASGQTYALYDFRLQGTSALQNAGDAGHAPASGADFYGNTHEGNPDIGPFEILNNAPTFVNMDAVQAGGYSEGGGAVSLDLNGSIADADLDALNGGNGNYDGASLSVARQSGADADDLFSFPGTSANLTFNPSDITHTGSGDVIATIANAGGTITINFTDVNGTIPTTALVAEALQSLRYDNASVDPPTSLVQRFTFDDGSGAPSATVSHDMTINITVNNSNPLFTNLDTPHPTGYTENGAAITLDTDATISDVELDDRADYAGSSLTVQQDSGPNANDVFAFDTGGALFTVNGSALEAGGLDFASFTNAGGSLAINFTSGETTATSTLVDDVLQHITYMHNSEAPPATLYMRFDFDDGDSANIMHDMQIDITANNDQPSFSGLDANHATGFVEGGAPIKLDADGTLADVELDALDDFGGGSLTLQRVGGADADDAFAFDLGGASFNINGAQLRSGVNAFATFTSVGGTLTITFTSAATTATGALVDDVLQHITYENTSTTPPANVALRYTFDDGDGGATPTVTHDMTVGITPDNSQPQLQNLAATHAMGFTEGNSPVRLDTDGTIADIELDALNGGNGNYGTAILTLTRTGGANAEDVFALDTAGASFTVSGNQLLSGGLEFANFTSTGGALSVNFNSIGTPATSALADDVLQHITYANSSTTPPASVALHYTFDDGSGESNAVTTHDMTVPITATEEPAQEPAEPPYVPPPAESGTTDTSTDTSGEIDVTSESFEVTFDGESDPLFESEVGVGDVTVEIGVSDLGLDDGTEPTAVDTPAEPAEGDQPPTEATDTPTPDTPTEPTTDEPATPTNEGVAKTPEPGVEPTPEPVPEPTPAPQPEPVVPDQPAAEVQPEPAQPLAATQNDLQQAIQDLDHAWDATQPQAESATVAAATALLHDTQAPLDTATATAVVQAVKTLDTAARTDADTAALADPVVSTSLSMLQAQGAEAAPIVRDVLVTTTDTVAASLAAQPVVEAAWQVIQTQTAQNATPVLRKLVEKVEASEQQLETASQSLTQTLKAAAKGGGDRAAVDAVAAAQASMHHAQHQLTVAYRVLQVTTQSLQGFDPAGNRDAIASLRQAITESRTLAMQLLAEAGDNPDPLTRDAVEALIDSMEHNAEKLATEVEIQKQAAETMQELEGGQDVGAAPAHEASTEELAALAAGLASMGMLTTSAPFSNTERKTA